jgi:hypothetical protein
LLPAGQRRTGVHDRRHERAWLQREDAQRPHSQYPRIRRLHRQVSRHSDPEDLRRFQLHQGQGGVRPASINSAVAAVRFFFAVTLDRPDLAWRLTVVRELIRLPATERRGGHAAAPGSAGAEVQGGIRHRLGCRAARFRGHRAQGQRGRLRAHAPAGRTG